MDLSEDSEEKEDAVTAHSEDEEDLKDSDHDQNLDLDQENVTALVENVDHSKVRDHDQKMLEDAIVDHQHHADQEDSLIQDLKGITDLEDTMGSKGTMDSEDIMNSEDMDIILDLGIVIMVLVDITALAVIMDSVDIVEEALEDIMDSEEGIVADLEVDSAVDLEDAVHAKPIN